jgi:RimJ/RimL family protein N-acetyltransferase
MIKLQPFSEEYLEKTFLWMQDDRLKNAFLLNKTVSRQSHQKWFIDFQKDETQKMYAILYQGVHVGNVGLKNIDTKNKNAECWIYLGDAGYKGKGIAKDSLEALSEKMKGEYIKLYARIADFNIPSIKTFTSAGYQLEGILQKEVIFKGKVLNIYRFYVIL